MIAVIIIANPVECRRFRNRHHARATRERKKLRLEALAIEYDVLKRTVSNMCTADEVFEVFGS